MKEIIQNIDRAIKRLYSLEIQFCAEDFIMRRPIAVESIGTASHEGALYLRGVRSSLELGIYLSPEICGVLNGLRLDYPLSRWSRNELHCFAVTTEEISHFLYLLHHASAGRSVSQLELELQGEIDKFLILSFLASNDNLGAAYDLFEKIFMRFHLKDHLTSEQRERYSAANRLAKRFIQRYGFSFHDPSSRERAFRLLRRFYRLNMAEKMSILGPH